MKKKPIVFLNWDDIEAILRRLYVDDVLAHQDVNPETLGSFQITKEIRALPPADAVPGEWYRELKEELSHSRHIVPIQWLPVTEGFTWALKCSNCGYVDRDTFDKNLKNFCPICGGMRVKEEK